QPPPARDATAGAGAWPRAALARRGAGSLRTPPAFPIPSPVWRDDDVRRAAASPLQRVPRRAARLCPRLERHAQGARLVNPAPGFDPRLRSTPGRRDPGQIRVMAIAAMVALGLMVIIGQLWYLQVLEGGRFLDASDKNRIRIRPIAAPRGILFDRNGVPLVDNRPAFTLSIIPRELDDRDAVLGRLATLLELPYQELVDALGR